MGIRMVYIGDDPIAQYLPGVPASDHEVQTVAEATRLIRSGLYTMQGGLSDEVTAAVQESIAVTAAAAGPDAESGEALPSSDGASAGAEDAAAVDDQGSKGGVSA